MHAALRLGQFFGPASQPGSHKGGQLLPGFTDQPTPSLPSSYSPSTSGRFPKGALTALAASPESCPEKTGSCPQFSNRPRPCSLQTHQGKRESLQSQAVCKTVPREEKDNVGEKARTQTFLSSTDWKVPEHPCLTLRKSTHANKSRETSGLATDLWDRPLSSFASLYPSPPYQPSSSGQGWQGPGTGKADMTSGFWMTNHSALCKGLAASPQTCSYEGEPTSGHLRGHWKDNEVSPTGRDDSEEEQKGNSMCGTLWLGNKLPQN